MKPRLATAILFTTATLGHAAPSAPIATPPALIPLPNKMEAAATGAPGFSLTGGLAIAGSKSAPEVVAAATAAKAAGLSPRLAAAGAGDALTLRVNSTLKETLGTEGYRLTITPAAVTIEAAGQPGVFYAMQTLLQAVTTDAKGAKALPAMQIEDQPRFGWRGLMLDPARHFTTVAEVKRTLDLMAMHKLNIMHWHLTDDQGWRIEIKKYPKLTQVGSIRTESPVPGNRNKGDGKPYGPFFYTQAQVKEIVAYAKARHITVIPEIEMPGHAVAAIKAYPELGNSDLPNYKPEVRVRWGVEDFVYAPKEETFRFISDVIAEVAALFPDSPYIHIGGDECPKTQWDKSPFAQKVMRDHNLLNDKGQPDSHKLQSWFIQRVEKMIHSHGKKLIGWDEIQEGGLSPTATMMVWRDWKWAMHALERGNSIVMAPTSHTYFDYGQGAAPKDPWFDVIGGNLPLEKVYGLDPVPAQAKPEQHRQVLGCQAQLWSEYIFDQQKLEYMAFPRACALAEVAWTQKERKNEADFKQRLATHLTRLDTLKVNYRKNDGTPAAGKGGN